MCSDVLQEIASEGDILNINFAHSKNMFFLLCSIQMFYMYSTYPIYFDRFQTISIEE